MSDEMWIKIFAFLPPHVLCKVGLVCSEWQRLACDNMLWKEHYRAAWPWETSVLATAGRVQRRDSSADAGTDGPEQHDVKKRSKSATAGHTFAVPHPRGVVGGTSSSQLNGSRKRKADEVASNKEGSARVDSIEKEKREKRGRLSATADEAFGSPVMGETDDDEMVVTVSPHLAGALETSDTHKPRSDGAHDILSRVFNINRKQHGLEIVNPLLRKQVVLSKPPLKVHGRWKSLFFAKKKYERKLLQALPKEEDLVHSLPCSLEELYNGRVRKMKITRHVVCTMCGGAGGMTEGAAEECTECNGIGTKTITKIMPPLFQQLVSPCRKCNTRGYTLKACERCPLCAGRSVVYRPEILEVKVERGMALGQRLVFPGMSDAKPGSRAGDVIFTIAEKKEDNKPFQRIGTSNDLLYTQHLTLHEALTGAAFPIIHMDNRVLLVRPHEYGSFAGIIKTGDMVVIRGEGMPVLPNMPKTPAYSSAPKPKAGDLHIIFNVVFPTQDDIAKSEEKKKVFARVVEDLALLQPREPIEAVIAGRSVVPVFATKAPAKPATQPDNHHRGHHHRNGDGGEARARRKAEKRKKQEEDKNDAESVKCHQQ